MDDWAALLPTPQARDWKGKPGAGFNIGNLPTAVGLLPTPAASRSGRQKSASGGATVRPSLDMVSSTLLPTPRATDGVKGGPNQRGSSGDLMLPAAVQPQRFGRYQGAVDHWAQVLGRPVPEPTEPSKTTGVRLSPLFVEWLMGLPAGWVTDLVGRSDALRLLGNGVVPPQCAHALRQLAAIT